MRSRGVAERPAADRQPQGTNPRPTDPSDQSRRPPWSAGPWTSPSSLQVIQAISEELGAGLSSVMSAREVLLDPRSIVANPDSARQMLSIMARGITRLGSLSQILRDLIDLADLQQGRTSPDLARVDVRQVVHRAVEEVAAPAALYSTSFQINLDGPAPALTIDAPRVRRALRHILGYCQRTATTAEVVLVSGRTVHGYYEISIQPRRLNRSDPGVRARVQAAREEAEESLDRRGRYLSLLVAHGYIAACGGQLRLDASEAGLRTVTCTLPLTPQTQ